ncbi:sugar ABC transporter substrate-binding protein [Tessaracoccus sp. ZS01]|nr:sugar ABC transporter substrate-binding protein [Tessaracoccus sp. ZS01]
MEGSISEGAQKYLKETFESEYPGNTMSVEIQPWDGIVSKIQTSLASKSESPDLVETGNTQSAAFSSVGAFADVSDLYDSLGGDKLIPSFVDAGLWEGKNYSYPLYAGARGLYYRKDLFEKADIAVPTTLDEFHDAVIKLDGANPDGVPGFSGMYLAAVDIHGAESVWFAGGGHWAAQEGDKWVGKLTAPESIEAMERVSSLFKNGSAYALDSQASQKEFWKYFNEEKVGVLVGTGNVTGNIDQRFWDEGKVGVMPLPGNAPGEVGATFAGGSNISMSQNSPNPELARAALGVIFSEGFQKLIAADGWVPGNTAFGDEVPGEFGKISAEVVENSRLTPNTPSWAVAAGDNLVRDYFTAIAQGGDVTAVSEEYNAKFEEALNS